MVSNTYSSAMVSARSPLRIPFVGVSSLSHVVANQVRKPSKRAAGKHLETGIPAVKALAMLIPSQPSSEDIY
jgi:hypothetical protein